jgi:hypothetical protein
MATSAHLRPGGSTRGFGRRQRQGSATRHLRDEVERIARQRQNLGRERHRQRVPPGGARKGRGASGRWRRTAATSSPAAPTLRLTSGPQLLPAVAATRGGPLIPPGCMAPRGAVLASSEAVGKTPDELAGSVLWVGSEDGHHLRRAMADGCVLVALSLSGTHFRERAAAFPTRLFPTASSRSGSAGPLETAPRTTRRTPRRTR